jgi:hypothetical protein
MTAHEHFEQLMVSYPLTESDYDANGKATDEAGDRASDWAWEQMTEAEHVEFQEQCRWKQAEEIFDGAVARGRIVLIPGEDTYYDPNEYNRDEKVKAGIDALVAAGSHYRGQDDEETGEPRFFAVQREETR